MARRGRKDLTGWLCHFVHGTEELEDIHDALEGKGEKTPEEGEEGAKNVWKTPLQFIVDFGLLSTGSDEDEGWSLDGNRCEADRTKSVTDSKKPEREYETTDLGQSGGNGFGDDDSIDFSSLFPDFQAYEELHPLHKGASALEVLLRILESGHLRASWSFRGGKPTIYGQRAACCFTEMPLYALIRYAEDRKHKFASNYGIAVKRDEMFLAGARPVIYGLSGKHLENKESNWPRLLEPKCGIGHDEQYRYVSLNLSGSKHQSDWMHEREWRWPFSMQDANCPGISLWLNPPTFQFSRILIFVDTEAEAEQVLNKLKQTHDAALENDGYSDMGGWQFKPDMFTQTYVFSLEAARQACSRKGVSPEFMRIEDIPKRFISAFSAPEATPELIDRVRESLKKAKEASIFGASEFRRSNPDAEQIPFSIGYASVNCISAQSPVVNALKILQVTEQECVYALGDTGYCLDVIAHEAIQWRSIFEAEAAGEAAAEVLRECLPEAEFEVISRLD